MGRLTKAMSACLEYYRDNEHNPCRIQRPPYRWTTRQLNTAIDRQYLLVGPGGWHVLTDVGRASLKANADGGA